MAINVAKAASWLHQVHRARAVVGWWPAQHATKDERAAYKVQDALLRKLVPSQGPLVGYKIALTSQQIYEQTGLRGPAYGPIRKKRVFEHKQHVRPGFTSRYGCTILVWYETYETREGAFRRERRLKEWRRSWKLMLIEARNPTWRDLYDDLVAGLPAP